MATVATVAADSGELQLRIRPFRAGDAREQAAVRQMYLANYDAYAQQPCGAEGCRCAQLGASMRRYTEQWAHDMDDIAASHHDTGGQFWVVTAAPGPAVVTVGGCGHEHEHEHEHEHGEPVMYAGCVGAMRRGEQLAELHRLSVAPRFRRRALGTKLVRVVEGWAREQGMLALFLTTWPPKGCPGTAASSDLCEWLWLVAGGWWLLPCQHCIQWPQQHIEHCGHMWPAVGGHL
jgi:GNAT superfamily N-acetyltransferase